MTVQRVYVQRGTNLHRPPRSDLHQTSGLAHNWALDFMAHSGTPVCAPEKCTVFKLSGHDPKLGVVSGSVFGWSVYLHTPGGIIYFITHLGDRRVSIGQPLGAGDVIGHVGHWPHDEPRSHTHCGVTHPAGENAAKGRILTVAAAEMLP